MNFWGSPLFSKDVKSNHRIAFRLVHILVCFVLITIITRSDHLLLLNKTLLRYFPLCETSEKYKFTSETGYKIVYRKKMGRALTFSRNFHLK